jgi:hypothetical protein
MTRVGEQFGPYGAAFCEMPSKIAGRIALERSRLHRLQAEAGKVCPRLSYIGFYVCDKIQRWTPSCFNTGTVTRKLTLFC